MNKPKVSFDFDGTLGHREDVQAYCKQLLSEGLVDVHITTRRYGEGNGNESDPWWVKFGDKNWLEVYALADEYGIKRENITFLNMTDKVDFFVDNKFCCHIDDDNQEIDMINEVMATNAIYVKDKNWLETMNSIIKLNK